MNEELENETSTENVVLETAEERGGKMSKIPVIPQLGIVSLLLFVLLAGAIVPNFLPERERVQNTPTVVRATSELNSQPFSMSTLESHFADLEIQGKAAYVWDIKNQQALYAKNANQALPLASVTKLMTSLVAHEILNEEASVSINLEAARQDSSSGIPIGSTFTREDISDLILLGSSNDGAFALANAAGAKLSTNNSASAFVAAMNIRAEELGLSVTNFKNPTGLDVSTTEAGAVGSARDMAFLFEYIIEHSPELLETTTASDARIYTKTGEYVDAENTNHYIGDIPGLIGSKTGYTDLAGGNLTIAYNAGLNRPIVIVVLGSTQFARFTDVIKLMEKTNDLVGQE